MAGFEFGIALEVTLFLFAVWAGGRLFQLILRLPPILGYLAVGVLFGPRVLDMVPYASDGACDSVANPQDSSGSTSGSGDGSSSGDGSGDGYPKRSHTSDGARAQRQLPEVAPSVGERHHIVVQNAPPAADVRTRVVAAFATGSQ